MFDFRYLWELQSLEEQRQTAEKKLKSIPEFKELKQLKEEIEKGQEGVKTMKEEVTGTKRDLREIEDSIAVLKYKTEKADEELYSGQTTNTKELEIAQKNLQAIRQKTQEGEDRALRLMEVLEAHENRLNGLTDELEQKKKDFRLLNKFYNEKKVELAAIREDINARQELIREKIPPEVMEAYLKLCEKMPDRKGLARLEKGVCSGCHMTVSFDLLRQAKGKDAVLCDNCGRMLLLE